VKDQILQVPVAGTSVTVEVRGLEVAYNRGEFEPAAWGIAPVGLPYATVRRNAVMQDDRGFFSRQDIDYIGLAKRFTTDPKGFGLTDWQLLNQASWKTEHGTLAAARRFTNKHLEEVDELSDAIELYDGSSTAKHAVASEAGDVLWCLLAICSNSGARIETAIQRKVLAESLGNVLLDRNQKPIVPSWKKTAGKVALRNITQNTLGNLEKLFRKGYIPTDTTGFLVPEDEFNDPYETLPTRGLLRLTAGILQNMVQIQFEDDTEADVHLYQTPSSFAYQGEQIAAVAAGVFMNVAYAAKRVADVELSDIATENYAKTTARVIANLVDKTDGERPAELL
jgi:NTP pyrophosphatase (non-canonical NTP hydrolase)